MAIIVKSSSLHGAGVYTTAPIKKGAHILEYTGPRLTAKACEGMYADTEVTYLFAMDDDQIDNRIWIMALRDIEAGEELTYDYNLFDGDIGEKAPCYCGLKNCRRTMFSEEEVARQKKVLRQRKKRREAARLRREKEKRAAARRR